MAIGGLAIIAGALMGIGKAWRPLRRTIALIDALAGRPERYPGDPEARPGIIQRLDCLDDKVTSVDQRLSGVEHTMNVCEKTCPAVDHLRKKDKK